MPPRSSGAGPRDVGAPCHVFVDESKRGAYLLIAAFLLPARIGPARQVIRSLTLRGQQRIHMKNEGDQRRRQILSALERERLTVTIYRATTNQKNDLTRRRACLEALVVEIAHARHTKLCLESDETMDSRDRKDLAALTRQFPCHDSFFYLHERAQSEPLLVIPDAVGWAWARGGTWRSRADSLVDRIVEV